MNVIVGANGSEKSNLIEALSIIQAAPLDLPKPIREGGGVTEWLWKGPGAKGIAEIELTAEYPLGKNRCVTVFHSLRAGSGLTWMMKVLKTNRRLIPNKTMSISITATDMDDPH